MQTLEILYLNYLINSIDEVELINGVVKWHKQNKEELDKTLNENLIQIVRLNRKTDDKFEAPKMVLEIINQFATNFQKNKENYAKKSLQLNIEKLLTKKLRPIKFWAIIQGIEQTFDYPDWLENLYNVFDWTEEGTLSDDHMEQECKKVLSNLFSN